MKKIFTIISTAAVALSLTGCEDFLNPKQIDIVYNDVFWETQTDAEVGLSGIYSLYRGLMGNGQNWYSRADATTGFIRNGWNGGSPSALFTLGIYSDITSDSKMWGGLEGMADWSNYYKVIAHANMVIEKVNGIPEDRFADGAKDRILGEAYFLRGLVYFNLLRTWGNVPYYDYMIGSSSQVIDEDLSPVLIPRTEDIDVCLGVIKDAERAVEKLQYSTPGAAGWGIRANKGSAQVLLAHANMWMNFMAKRDHIRKPLPDTYIEAAIAALEDFNLNSSCGYIAYNETTVKELYDGGSIEAVFELNVSSEQNESYRADQTGVTMYTCKMEPFDEDPKHNRSAQVDFVPFVQKARMYPEYDFSTQTGDIRPHLFFGAWDSTYNEPYRDSAPEFSDYTKTTWLKKYAIFTEDTYRKFDEYIAYFAEANIPVFRYTDAMLLLAEAYAKTDQPEKAVPIVDDIRTRAGLAPYSGSMDAIIDEIMQQRVGELFGEGYLYYDFVRNNWFPNSHLMGPAEYKAEAYYWPVSSGVMAQNHLIEQTPYWTGKTKW